MRKQVYKDLLLKEVSLYREAFKNKDYELCKIHLGRAHIVSQKSVSFHLYVHLLMTQYALLRQDFREVLGQVLRLAVTIPGHCLGRVPIGNTGWSNVGLVQKMPLPEDLEFELNKLR